MKPRIAALAITVWLISLVLAGALGRRLSSPRPEGRRSPGRAGDEPASVEIVRASELERPQEENAVLRRALGRGQSAPAPEKTPDPVATGKPAADASRIAYFLDRHFEMRREKLPSSDLEEAASLALHIARAGAAGVAEVARRVRDAGSPDERMVCLEVLSMVADPLALETILEFPWDAEAQAAGRRDPASWDWSLIERHLEQLPSSAIAPHLEMFEKRLNGEVDERAGDLGDDGLLACAQLALRHGSSDALAILRRVWPELDDEARSSLVDSLLFIDTPKSLGFLDEVSASDASEELLARAKRARGILARRLEASSRR